MNILRRTALAVSVIVLSSALPQFAFAAPADLSVPAGVSAVADPGPVPVDDFVRPDVPPRHIESEYTYVDQPLAGTIKTTLVTVKLADKTVEETNAAVPMAAAQASLSAASAYWSTQTVGRVNMSLIKAETARPSAARSTQSPNEIVDIVSRELGWTQTSYTALVMYIPGAYLTNGAAGMAFSNGSVGGRIIMPQNGRLSTPVLTHEFGHALGLDHANSLQCGSGISDVAPGPYGGFADSSCSIKTYGDNLDVMGISHYDFMPAIGAPFWEMGRFGNGNEIADAGTVTATKSLTLKPWAGTGAARAAKFTDPKSGEVYYLELRAPVGYDVGKAIGGNRGVKISQQGSGNSSILLPPSTFPISGNYSSTQAWQAGATFKTHAGTKVTIDSVSDTSATVTLRPPGAPGIGAIDAVELQRDSSAVKLVVRGWAYDGAKPAESSDVHVYLKTPDGVERSYAVPANQPRPDVNSVMQVTGQHGYSKTFDVTAAGPYRVCVYAMGSVENTYLGCRTVTAEASPPPLGVLDSFSYAVESGKGVLKARGWAFDAGASSASIPVHIYLSGPSGQSAHALTANGSRPDVNSVFSISGAHGFSLSTPVTQGGRYTACAYGLFVAPLSQGNSFLGCKEILLPATPAPAGFVDSVSLRKVDTKAYLSVSGWTADLGSPLASIPVHVYVTSPDGSVKGQAFTADRPRADINSALGITGNHGFEPSVEIQGAGTYRVCAYGIPVSPLAEGNSLLGCRSINVPATPAPVGSFDSLVVESGAAGSVLVSKGWAYDPAFTSASIPVHAYLTAPDGAVSAVAFTADVPRPDVNKVMGIPGNHGYTVSVPLAQRGKYTLCTWGLAVSSLSAGVTQLGCRAINY
ncbi:hypothetical protein [Pseudarthrobacter sp. CCNWLW207]|uniref:hypothetical protein n=1 Tax=Pseudarthrobacter sp. CCNWLW207 TaxID=3127468 RepID=UPI0030786D2D